MAQNELLRSRRRPLMRALGAGAALSMLGGSAVAQGDDGSNDDDVEMDKERTVHTVETLIRAPPTNPERPADFLFEPTGLHVQPGDVVKFVFRTPDHNVVTYHPAFGMRRRVPTGVAAFSSPLLGWRSESIPGDQVEPPAEMAPGEGTGGPGGDADDSEDDDGDESDDGGNGDDSDDSDDDDDDSDDNADGPVPDVWLHAFEEPGVYDLLCSPHEHFGMAMRVVVGDVADAPFETSDPEDLPEPRVGPVGLARVTLTDPALEPSNVVEEGTVTWDALEANRSGGDGEESADENGENEAGDASGENGTPTDNAPLTENGA